MKIRDQILILLHEKGDLSVKEMTDLMEVSKQAIHIANNQLLEENLVVKFGKVPKSIYRLSKPKEARAEKSHVISESNQNILMQHFLVITEVGKMLEGWEGFLHWCQQRSLPPEKTLHEYTNTLEKYERYYDQHGLINGIEKLNNTKGYDKIYLDEVYYLDFYAIERFGKTKLGTLLHYAKQGQNKPLMKILINALKPKLDTLLKLYDFDAIAFVPPTVKREVQLMKFLETHLKINLPKINIKKITGIIPVPQKSLSKIEERINNAENTFAVAEGARYDHILLIDDAVGSGSTLNQITGKIKQKGIAKKITGLAIVGSFKGFDVVTDV